ncbi:MAG: amylo-alpha-1,6-glucosidase [Anaerolineales bacterium]
MVDLGRARCGDLRSSERREWLVTNGSGGYAAGTVAGLLTRRYHGLLLAALRPPLGRTLLVSKLDETVTYAGKSYPLYVNRWKDGVVEPAGNLQIERFHLEGTTPVWTFAMADALLEKRIWMQRGVNTTYVQYHLRRATAPVSIAARVLVNHRDFHVTTHADGWQMQIASYAHGLKVTAYDGAAPFYLFGQRADLLPRHDWYRDFYLTQEAYRGLDAAEDHLHAADFGATLHVGETAAFICSTQAAPNLDATAALAELRAHETALLASVPHAGPEQPDDAVSDRLALAADQFIVARPLADDGAGCSIIAGYPWFGDWGRDTMIALPGLTLSTGRPQLAADVLRTFARYVDRGMLPNRFPDNGEQPEYNTVDATLWYFEAVRAYHAATGDDALLRELFPILEDIVHWHLRGTRYNIHVDAQDGLLYAGEPGQQLTWMDAKVGDWVVTPRIGKPVEVNALWYNALRSMAAFASVLGAAAVEYEALAEQARTGFARFWHAERDYCYDVLDTPHGDDASLRPNQLFAVALPHSPLAGSRQKAVVDVCARELLTSHGLRSLAPDDPAYRGRYGGDQRQRDGAYHQGTVWGWLIGPFVQAHLRIYRDPALARSFLTPLLRHLTDRGLGSVSEIFDGDAPFTPRGCFAQAWSVGELLRAWQATWQA